MRGMNRVILVGNLGKDVELRTSHGGTPWAKFSLATGRSRKTATGWVEDTDWHQVRVFQTQAELCHRHLQKGDPVAIEGSVTYDMWTDKQGNSRTSAVVLVDRVHFLNKRRAQRPAEEEPEVEEVEEVAHVAQAK
ncbi:MAG: single-strand DNA-binding protein [Kiritimatiellia bacterium]|jgi:single-strand DNA-binding protein